MNRPLPKTFQIIGRTTKWRVDWQRSSKLERSIVGHQVMDTLGHPPFAIKNSQIDSPYMKDNFMALYLVSTRSCDTRCCGFPQVDRITNHVILNYEQRS